MRRRATRCRARARRAARSGRAPGWTCRAAARNGRTRACRSARTRACPEAPPAMAPTSSCPPRPRARARPRGPSRCARTRAQARSTALPLWRALLAECLDPLAEVLRVEARLAQLDKLGLDVRRQRARHLAQRAQDPLVPL